LKSRRDPEALLLGAIQAVPDKYDICDKKTRGVGFIATSPVRYGLYAMPTIYVTDYMQCRLYAQLQFLLYTLPIPVTITGGRLYGSRIGSVSIRSQANKKPETPVKSKVFQAKKAANQNRTGDLILTKDRYIDRP